MGKRNPKVICVLLFLLVIVNSATDAAAANPCIPRDFGKGSVVCVCNSTYCDSAEALTAPNAPGVLQIYTSTKSGLRLQKSTQSFSAAGTTSTSTSSSSGGGGGGMISGLLGLIGITTPNTTPTFSVSHQQSYQSIIGFGGSFTDATGINVQTLSQQAQDNLFKSYFGPSGSDYNLARVPIGGTDFSTYPYTLDDASFEDTNLTNFALQPEDHQLKIPYIKVAQALAGSNKIRFLGSAWSAPAWMKTNNQLYGLGYLKQQFYQVWADYHVRFIDAYQAESIPIWAITTGNEPSNGEVPLFPFNCMGWTSSGMKQWITTNLGPTMKNKEANVKIVIHDNSKPNLETFSGPILLDNSSAQYVDGVGTHWYLDSLTTKDVLTRFHNNHPNPFILPTEACLGFMPWELEKVILGSWERGETYLDAIINDINNFASGWIDWNLALSLQGGPNWAKFAADAAILVNPTQDEFFKQPIYFGLSHVSKFVLPDSKRIDLTGTNIPDDLVGVALVRPDNGTVLVFLNKGSSDIALTIKDDKAGSTTLTVPARSMQSVVYW